MKILIVNRYMDEKNEDDHCLQLCRALIGEGHEVTVLTTGDTFAGKTRQVHGLVEHKVENGIQFVRVKTLKHSGVGKRFFKSARLFTTVYKRIIRGLAVTADVIIIDSTAPVDMNKLVDLRRTGKLKNKKFILNLSELWPMSAVEKHGRHIGEFKYLNKMQFYEDVAFNNADAIISELEFADSYVLSRGYSTEDRFYYIPAGIDSVKHLNLVKPSDEVISLMSDLRQKGLFLLVTFDDKDGSAAIPGLIEAARASEGPVHTIIVADKEHAEGYRKLAGDSGRVTIFPFTDDNDLDNLLHAADMVYFGLVPQTLQRFGCDPKGLFRAMLSGRPLLYTGGGSRSHVESAKGGVCLPADDVDALRSALEAVPELPPQVLELMGEAGRTYVLDRYDSGRRLVDYLEVLTKEEDLYKRLVSHRMEREYQPTGKWD